MPAIRSTVTGRWVLNYGPPNGNLITGSEPSDLMFFASPPTADTPIRGMNGLFANPGHPGNDNVVWAPTPYTWNIQFDGPDARISDPNSGRFWVNAESYAIPLSPSVPFPLSTFNIV